MNVKKTFFDMKLDPFRFFCVTATCAVLLTCNLTRAEVDEPHRSPVVSCPLMWGMAKIEICRKNITLFLTRSEVRKLCTLQAVPPLILLENRGQLCSQVLQGRENYDINAGKLNSKPTDIFPQSLPILNFSSVS